MRMSLSWTLANVTLLQGELHRSKFRVALSFGQMVYCAYVSNLVSLGSKQNGVKLLRSGSTGLGAAWRSMAISTEMTLVSAKLVLGLPPRTQQQKKKHTGAIASSANSSFFSVSM